MEMTQKHVFIGRQLVAPKRAGFSVADVQSDVLSPSCLHVTAFSVSLTNSFADDVL